MTIKQLSSCGPCEREVVPQRRLARTFATCIRKKCVLMRGIRPAYRPLASLYVSLGAHVNRRIFEHIRKVPTSQNHGPFVFLWGKSLCYIHVSVRMVITNV